jgi:peroxiredoxin
MPAPIFNTFYAFLEKAALAQGFKKQAYDSNGKLVISEELPPAMKKFITAQALGITEQWAAWQAAQTVTVLGVTSGPSPASGPPGVALP